MDVSEPAGHGDDDIADACPELSCSNIAKLAEVCANKLCSSENTLLAKVVDLGRRHLSKWSGNNEYYTETHLHTDSAIGIDQIHMQKFLLDFLYLGVIETSPN